MHEITEIEKKVFNTLYIEQMLRSFFLNFQMFEDDGIFSR